MQYAISISYKYSLTELCILLYPFGLHRLSAPAPAPAKPQHWTRERLDTLRQHRSGRSTSPKAETDGERHGDSASGRAAQRSSPEAERQKSQSQHDSSSGDKTASRQPAPPKPQRSSQSQKSQKRGTVDHERRRAETERGRAEKERERRENDSKTPLFSTSHRTPSRSTASTSPSTGRHGQPQKCRLFRFCFCGVCGTNGDQRLFCYLHRGGWVYIFTPSATPKIWLCTLFSTPLSFSPNHHLPNTPFINDIFPYKYKYPLLQSSLRKNALINAVSSSSELHTKIYFHNFLLRNMP